MGNQTLVILSGFALRGLFFWLTFLQEVKKLAKIEAKQVVVNEIKEKVAKAGSMVLVSSRGLTVAQDTEMRKALREAGVDFKVYKNTLINLAIKDTAFAELSSSLEGPTAVVFSYDDATAAAREVSKFVDKYDIMSFKGGVVDGVYYDDKMIVKIAKIPSRDVLLSRLLGSFKAPMSSFARVVKEIAKKNGGEAAADAE